MLNLVVIRSPDIDASARFFSEFGLSFDKHSHGKGPMHCAAEAGGVMFEIYPQADESESTSSTRLGFTVADLDLTISELEALGAEILVEPKDSPWGRRAVVREPFGHKIEIVQQPFKN